MHACPRDGCDAVFPRPYRLAAHILTHDNKKGFKCHHENCSREYTNNSHLLRHYRTSHKSSEKTSVFMCPQCSKVYSNRQNLQRHLKFFHSVDLCGSPYLCGVCHKGFSKKHKLTAHMFRHTSVKAFCCEYCSKAFITLHDKKRHMRFHKTYQCNECEMKFQLWSKYQEHRKKFHINKEFICHHCDRSFKMRAHIVRHMKCHDDKRAGYLCPIGKCLKFYTTKFNLRQHIESVHEDRTFDCPHCDAKLSTNGVLKKHLRTHNTTPKTNKKPRIQIKERKDKGIPKYSVADKLAGLKLSKCDPLTMIKCDVLLS